MYSLGRGRAWGAGSSATTEIIQFPCEPPRGGGTFGFSKSVLRCMSLVVADIVAKVAAADVRTFESMLRLRVKT
jgi:hypothetical protein